MRASPLLRALGRRLALSTILTLAAASAAPAQSLLSTRGLGLEIEPRSTRSSALGGVSLGLPGAEISWTNPAGAVGLPAAGLVFAFQHDDVAGDYAGIETEIGVARFPLVMAAFPFGSRWAVSAGLGGFLDQNWALQRQDSIVLENETLQVTDRLSSEGGVGQLRLGAGYRLLDRMSIGLGVNLYTGSVRRSSGRIFPGEVAARCCQAQWDYSGVGFIGSVDWNPSEAVSLSAGAGFGGTLDASSRGDVAESVSYSMPASADVGASARIAPALLLALGADWRGWSTLDGALSDGSSARDAWSVQGGLEWDALTLGSRSFPLRLGGRTGALPFRAGAEGGWADERAVTGGLGLVLGGGAASLDVGVERGERSGAVGVDESFWRVLLSVSVLGQ